MWGTDAARGARTERRGGGDGKVGHGLEAFPGRGCQGVRPDLSSQGGTETMPLSPSSYCYVLFINPVWFMATDGY